MAGFNLVAVVNGEGLCLHYDGALRPVRFGAGAHVVSSNRDFNDPSMPERQVFDRWRSTLQGIPGGLALTRFLSSHEGERPVCKHGREFGTVSASLLFSSSAGMRLLHADGPPCSTAFEDYSAFLTA